MKKTALPLFVALLGLLIPAPVLAQGTLLDAKVKFEHASYDSALVDAEEHYEGDLLIYFFQNESGNHQDFLSQALNNDTLAHYMNDNFARIAIDTATPEGQDVLSQFRDDLPDWDFIVVQYAEKSDPVGRGMHGWENIESQEDVVSWLKHLKKVKEREPLHDSKKN